MSESFERVQVAQDLSIGIHRSLKQLRLFTRVWFFSLIFVTFLVSVKYQIGNVPLVIFLMVLLVGQILIQFYLVRIRKNHEDLQMQISDIYVAEKAKSPQTCGSMDPHFTQAR